MNNMHVYTEYPTMVAEISFINITGTYDPTKGTDPATTTKVYNSLKEVMNSMPEDQYVPYQFSCSPRVNKSGINVVYTMKFYLDANSSSIQYCKDKIRVIAEYLTTNYLNGNKPRIIFYEATRIKKV